MWFPSSFQDIPPPGSYEVQKAFSKTQGKIVPGPPRTNDGKRKQGAFQSSASRFAPPRDVVIEETDPSMPGRVEFFPLHIYLALIEEMTLGAHFANVGYELIGQIW